MNAMPRSLDDARALARERLTRAARRLTSERGGEAPGGQLLRPLAAWAVAAPLGADDDRFWLAALAVQLAHEASLVHDDIIDAASTRRGEPTLAASAGVSVALLEGDHLLALAYRAAIATGCTPFAERFALAVERTIAAERRQGETLGHVLRLADYEEIAGGKSGELLGCALAAAPTLLGRDDAERFHALGRRLGLLYQMTDDFLDCVPELGAGKPTLGDAATRRWTWLHAELEPGSLALPPDELVRALRARRESDGTSAMTRGAAHLRREIAAAADDCARLLPDSTLVGSLLDAWRQRVDAALGSVARQALHRLSRSGGASPALAARVPAAGEWPAFLARHSRSFHFATRFLRGEAGARIGRIYAFCRVTDDLADDPALARGSAEELLDEWMSLARAAYDGRPTGLELVDRTMSEMASAGVPFARAAALADGMRMDLRGTRYATLAELREYTARVAAVVGVWISEMAGVRDRAVLARAEQLGHAMQLTNILRDVGEDWRAGRVYLPDDLLARHGLGERDIAALGEGRRPVDAAWRDAMEELMSVAERDYRTSFPWIAHLPRPLHAPVAVAARVYEGIHDAIRANGYDNITRRAHTSGATKTLLALRASRDLARARRSPVRAPGHGALPAGSLVFAASARAGGG